MIMKFNIRKRIQIFIGVGLISLFTSSLGFAASVMNGGEVLVAGDIMLSENQDWRLNMQNDGNLVLYRASNNQVMWASYTQGNPGARVTMQTDGNFVIYSASNAVLWATYTQRYPGSTINLQNDGNLVIYSAQNEPVWASNTAQTTTSCRTVSDPVYGGTEPCYFNNGTFVFYNVSATTARGPYTVYTADSWGQYGYCQIHYAPVIGYTNREVCTSIPYQ